MIYILFAAVSVAAVYFCVRFLLLQHSIRSTAEELRGITGDLEQNRVVRLTCPQKKLEILLIEINRNLEEIRRTRVIYDKKEQELLRQIENISHDLRTPLTAILGFLQLIDNEILDEDSRESLEIVKKKAVTLRKLIEEFYDLSQMTADDYRLDKRELDLGRILRETVMDSYQELRQKNLEVQIVIPDEPVYVLGDENALARIFQNLLQNAGRYADEQLEIYLLSKENEVLVRMQNDSERLTEEDVETMFDRFRTGDNSRNREGTGLGLSIAKYLAELQGGDLQAHMEMKQGATWVSMELKVPILKI